MIALSFFVAGSALFDSISTTQQIIILVLLFSTERPILTSLGFILGVTVAYFLCGLAGLALVGQLNAMVQLFVPNLNAVPDHSYYQIQSLLGLVLFAAGPVYWWYQSRSQKPPVENRLLSRLKKMNFWVALALGALLSATSFPTALPYVASLEKIAAAPMGLPGQLGFVLFYNVVYALPLVVPFVLFVVLRDAILPQLHLHAQRLNRLITIVMLSGMGLFFIADALAFFWTGKPILQSRFL